MKHYNCYLIFILLCSCLNAKETSEILYDYPNYKLVHNYIDKGKFVNSYFELVNKNTGKVKILNNYNHQVYMDSIYLYYFDYGSPGIGYFVEIVNTKKEFKFDIDTISTISEFQKNKIQSGYIYTIRNDSLTIVAKLDNMDSFEDLQTGTYYITYPGIFYSDRIEITSIH